MRKARERQTWYLPMGTAVHTIGEHKIKTGEELEFESVFFPLVREQRKIEPDTTKWLAGGPKDNQFRGQRVVDLGKQCVESYFKFLEKFTVLYVEHKVTSSLPGLDVPVLGYIDLVGEHEDHGLLLVDAKTSAQKPKNNVQLETYNVLHNQPGYRGYWLMLRPDAKPKTEKARVFDFTMTPEELGARYQRAYLGMQEKKYAAANVFCDFCTQRPNCLVQAGPTDRAKYYDKSEEEGVPF